MGSFSRVREERFRALGRNVFGKEDGFKAMVEFLESIGMRLRLRDLGCKLGDAELIADLAIKSSPMVKTHPTPLDANAIAKIYRDSY
jgi:alcohol dehydrogenase class IV